MSENEDSNEVAVCSFCGAEFLKPVNRFQKYCCAKCRLEADRVKRSKKPKKKETFKNLAVENEIARSLGMTYGEYQAFKYMQRGG